MFILQNRIDDPSDRIIVDLSSRGLPVGSVPAIGDQHRKIDDRKMGPEVCIASVSTPATCEFAQLVSSLLLIFANFEPHIRLNRTSKGFIKMRRNG